MRVVIIGGTGLIGSRVARLLESGGHEVLAAAPSTGVDVLTGAGVDEALAGADVVVDVANSPSFEDAAALDFFTRAGRTITAAGVAAGVRHHVALSVVGADRNPGIGYMRAKMTQEAFVREAGTPFTIVRATQFLEFLRSIADAATTGEEAHVTPARLQPVAADDVAAMLADVVVGEPVNGMLELGGPVAERLDVLVGRVLAADGDPRHVVTDPSAGYFGALIDDHSLTPGAGARIGTIDLDAWLASRAASMR